MLKIQCNHMTILSSSTIWYFLTRYSRLLEMEVVLLWLKVALDFYSVNLYDCVLNLCEPQTSYYFIWYCNLILLFPTNLCMPESFNSNVWFPLSMACLLILIYITSPLNYHFSIVFLYDNIYFLQSTVSYPWSLNIISFDSYV